MSEDRGPVSRTRALTAGRNVGSWIRQHQLQLAHVAIGCAVILPIGVRAGWPYNHEVSSLFERVEAFRREFAAGNFFPLWTPFCFKGHGTPMPFLYHRLFNTVAGLLALPFGAIGGVKRALALALIVGSLGISAAARELGCRPSIRFWCGAMLPIAPYTFTNWLIRGSGAELAAGMLIPWLIVPCLRMLAGKPFGARLGAVLSLIFYAHVAIFLYTIPLMVAVVVVALLAASGARAQVAVRILRGVGVAAAIVALVVGPYVAAIALIGKQFNIGRFSMYLPQNERVGIVRYFADNFPWGHAWHGLSVEISRFLLIGIAGAGLVIAIKRVRVAPVPLAFLIASMVAYFWFQLAPAAPLYRAVPVTQILQFPWRLLVFLTPLAILLLAVLAGAVADLGGRWPLVAVALLVGPWCAQMSVAWTAYGAEYQWIGADELAQDLARLDGPPTADEFLPSRLAGVGPPPRAPLFAFDGCRLVSASIDLQRLATVPFETVDLRLTAPAAGCTVRFSQFSTVLVKVVPSAGGLVLRDNDETTVVTLPPGEGSIHVERRGLLRALLHALRGFPEPDLASKVPAR